MSPAELASSGATSWKDWSKTGELVAMINEVLGKKIEPVYRDVDIPNYVQDTLADTTKMRKMLGSHKVELKEGIKRIIQFQLNLS